MIKIEWQKFIHNEFDWAKNFVWLGWYWKEDDGERLVWPEWDRVATNAELRKILISKRSTHFGNRRWTHDEIQENKWFKPRS